MASRDFTSIIVQAAFPPTGTGAAPLPTAEWRIRNNGNGIEATEDESAAFLPLFSSAAPRASHWPG
jgi:hypothetical protein